MSPRSNHRRAVWVLFLAAALLALFIGFSEAAYEDLFREVKVSAWAIYVRGTGGLQAICSATAFKTDAQETQLLTAGHCFLGSDLARTDFLVTQDHRTFYKASLRVSGLKSRENTSGTSSNLDDYSGDDWAVVTARVGNQPVLSIGTSGTLSVGEDLLVVGVPFGMDFLAVQGIVGSLDISLSPTVWNHYAGANIFVAGGNSGSGVISVKQRAIVGIVNAGPGAQSSMMIFMPTDKLPAEVAQ